MEAKADAARAERLRHLSQIVSLRENNLRDQRMLRESGKVSSREIALEEQRLVDAKRRLAEAK